MATKKFNDFSADTQIATTDIIVGYGSTSAGTDEARWTFESLSKAVIGQAPLSPIQVQVAATVNRANGARYNNGAWFNVRSVTDDSAARKTINFTTPLPSNNYVCLANPLGGTSDAQLHYEAKPIVKSADKVTIYHVTEHWLDREPAFDFVILQ